MSLAVDWAVKPQHNKTEGAVMSTLFSSTEGQVAPKVIDGCGWNSNSSFKFYDDPIKNEVVIMSTTYSPL